jgi:hypothetical protein
MPEPRPSARDLARAAPAATLGELATLLSKLIGPTGFDVLLSRALKLAAREDRTLAGVHAMSGGRL